MTGQTTDAEEIKNAQEMVTKVRTLCRDAKSASDSISREALLNTAKGELVGYSRHVKEYTLTHQEGTPKRREALNAYLVQARNIYEATLSTNSPDNQELWEITEGKNGGR
jgi:hypothetical protein